MRTQFLGIDKASDAVHAAILGLRQQSRRKNFTIAMGTYGSYQYEYNFVNNRIRRKVVCYGCLATCTLQKLSRFNFTENTICTRRDRADFLGQSESSIESFENAMDAIRHGRLFSIIRFFNGQVRFEDWMSFPNVKIDSENWKEHMTTLRKMHKTLIKHGY